MRRPAVTGGAELWDGSQLVLAEDGSVGGLVLGGLALAALLGALVMSQQKRADGAKEEELPPWADMPGDLIFSDLFLRKRPKVLEIRGIRTIFRSQK